MTASDTSDSVAEKAGSSDPIPGDLAMTRALWPLLLASAVGLLPFTVFSTYLVPIASETGRDVATVGGLRGLGGVAALAVGAALAPLIDRVPRAWAAAGGLALLGVAAALGAGGGFPLLAAFCLLTGAATAVLNPALATAAADRFGDGRAAGRAATLVSATTSMTSMLAAPLIALPAMVWGWQGDLLAVACLAVLLALVLLVRGRAGGPSVRRAQGPDGKQLPGYFASFRALAGVPGAVPLLLVSVLRTAVFMGYLAYLAAYYDDRFGLHPEVFSLVWTLSGASFFVSNLLTGRVTNAEGSRVGTERLLAIGVAAALVSAVGFWFTHWLPLALALTSLHAAAHAVVAACAVSLLVRRCGALRGTALSLNAAGQSLGVFAGAALGGAGLAVAGYPGIAAAFGGLLAVALVAAWLVTRRGPVEEDPACGVEEPE
ncbi:MULTISPECIES: MFS transporter [unclassified Streptomyces]|uniref:MFS transporter n=1 Tax=unclassified Streptomyces TaxID=2593676 RepID=UPI00278C204B|nr:MULTISPECIES: MFS transporter [unclassified Streptomyces]